MFEGVNQVMAEAGLGIGSLITRSISEEESLVRKEIHRLLLLDDRPTGLICLCPQFAETAAEVLKSESLRVPDDLDIIYSTPDKNHPSELNIMRVCPKITRQKYVALVVQTLEKIINGKPLENPHVNLPAELVGPEQGKQGT